MRGGVQRTLYFKIKFFKFDGRSPESSGLLAAKSRVLGITFNFCPDSPAGELGICKKFSNLPKGRLPSKTAFYFIYPVYLCLRGKRKAIINDNDPQQANNYLLPQYLIHIFTIIKKYILFDHDCQEYRFIFILTYFPVFSSAANGSLPLAVRT
jgi:hypothetical protein